jgi:NDP-sugar pyrophosphorylase family protein
MKAMILAAGLGTRLRPLTDERPKALVEIGGRTLLEITLRRLRGFGICEVMVNVHHFAEMVVEYLRAHDNFGMRVEISREEELLDTGGGLKKAAGFFLRDAGVEPFVLHNVDVLSSIDLAEMERFHGANKALATLAVMKRESSRQLLFDGQGRLCGRRSRGEAAEMVRAQGVGYGPGDGPPVADAERAFCGVHVISPGIFARMDEAAAFPIIPTYLRLAGEGEKIAAFPADAYYWRDLGTEESLRLAAEDVARGAVEA